MSGDVRLCHVPLRFSQVLSNGVRYMFEISVQILSGDVGFCQMPFRYPSGICQIPVRLCHVMSNTCLRYLSDFVRLCQVVSDSVRLGHILVSTIITDVVRCCQIICQIHVILCQTLSGDIRYMVDIRYTCHIMSASIKWCQLLSDSVRWCQVLRSEQQQGQHQQQQLGSCTRALVKGPAQGPLVRVLPKGPGEGHTLIYVSAL